MYDLDHGRNTRSTEVKANDSRLAAEVGGTAGRGKVANWPILECDDPSGRGRLSKGIGGIAMPCEWYKTADGTVMHINRGRGGRKQECKFCHKKYSEGKLCDFPVGNGKTCDAAMCNDCARAVGSQETDIGAGMKRLGDTVDLCPIHRDMEMPK